MKIGRHRRLNALIVTLRVFSTKAARKFEHQPWKPQIPNFGQYEVIEEATSEQRYDIILYVYPHAQSLPSLSQRSLRYILIDTSEPDGASIQNE